MRDTYDVTREDPYRTPGRRRNNWEASAPPTVTDDASLGYQTGSRWMVFATGESWTCFDASLGVANWRPSGIMPHGSLLELDEDDHLQYGFIFNTPNDPGTPLRKEAVWIDEDADGGAGGGAPVDHPHDADEVWYDDTDGDYPVTPVTVQVRPNEDGPSSGTIIIVGSGSNRYQQVDEPGASNRADYLRTDGGGTYALWFPEWFGSATDHIRRVRAVGDLENDAPGVAMTVKFRRKAEADVSATIISVPINDDGVYTSAWHTTNPFTGAPWQPEDLINIGLQVSGNSFGSTKSYTYQLYLEVEYDTGVTVQRAIHDLNDDLDAHTHPGMTPSATVVSEVTAGQAASAGASAEYSRGDHTHGTPASSGGGSSGGYPEGAAFPSGPTAGDKWYHTGIRGGMLFRYDGTRWLSDQLFVKQLFAANNLTADTTTYQVAFENDYNVYLGAWHGAYYLSGASATWVINLDHIPFLESSGYTNLDSVSSATYGNAAASWYLFRKALNLLKVTTSGNVAGNISGLRIGIDEQAGAVGFYGMAYVEYRLEGA